MADRFFKFTISTQRPQEFIDITLYVKRVINESGIKDGIAVVFCPHTTAGITINENSDPDVVRDIMSALEKAFPVKGDYRHIEGNSHAHIKASLMGSSCNIIVKDGELVLGVWQGIYFCEFDGPRKRSFFVKIVEG
ncbi:secondary thiamine-phosphate synthase enzyme [Caldanaerobius fijiensis DSM 17918]|uniref:Secondary thiamine-phosphate synthase enzyme n=1 Tax=Caldanaerobius fijiensis DSM 17918 TaxID=1121256 RepID=A0A1M5ERJ1_9THEO|nr:secondary thiamine-phosphate synthase enzyme YjbQ [Caldanaerobius fijiensis]SHF81754.1 secondary thiamine-phosphate synthase enzyme [Caldanaerobius fijiensis DSM 17918]